MHRSRLYFIFTGSALLLLLGLVGQSLLQERDPTQHRRLVGALGLTDLALFSEARYTRHPSQADLFSAFQDYPGALEHFPSGSLLAPTVADTNRWISIHSQDDGRLR